MTVYQRIANPWMPNGTAANTNAPYAANSNSLGVGPYQAPGELGGAFNEQTSGRAWVRVLMDSGATSATPLGVPAVGQTAFWKDRSASIVTNDKRFCDAPNTGSVNRVAGIIANAVTPGYITDLVIQGIGVSVASDGTGAAGGVAVSDSTASTARVAAVAAGTAPTSQSIGVIRGAAASNLISVDVSLGFIG